MGSKLFLRQSHDVPFKYVSLPPRIRRGVVIVVAGGGFIVRLSDGDLWIIHGRYISPGLVSVGVKLPVGIPYRLRLFSHSNEIAVK